MLERPAYGRLVGSSGNKHLPCDATGVVVRTRSVCGRGAGDPARPLQWPSANRTQQRSFSGMRWSLNLWPRTDQRSVGAAPAADRYIPAGRIRDELATSPPYRGRRLPPAFADTFYVATLLCYTATDHNRIWMNLCTLWLPAAIRVLTLAKIDPLSADLQIAGNASAETSVPTHN